MKLSCKQICRLQEIMMNLKCPKCFSVHVKLCDEEKEKNAECESCKCEFEFKPEILAGYE